MAEEVAEEAGEGAQEETEATEEENSEAAEVEAVKPLIMMEFGDVQTRRGCGTSNGASTRWAI